MESGFLCFGYFGCNPWDSIGIGLCTELVDLSVFFALIGCNGSTKSDNNILKITRSPIPYPRVSSVLLGSILKPPTNRTDHFREPVTKDEGHSRAESWMIARSLTRARSDSSELCSPSHRSLGGTEGARLSSRSFRLSDEMVSKRLTTSVAKHSPKK
jgi:hypothetical protein